MRRAILYFFIIGAGVCACAMPAETEPAIAAAAAPAAPQDDDGGDWVSLYTGNPRWPGGVWDGDTISVGDDDQRVRLLCIDTPEQGKPWRDEGGARLRELIAGNPVNLRYDSVRRTDRWGRTLAYVWVDVDGVLTDVADVLLSEGLAQVYEAYPCDYVEHYRRVQRGAQDLGLGIWSEQ